jgi:two-component system CheB/CheR fusion protein
MPAPRTGSKVESPRKDEPAHDFPIVGIGASAGGLAAIEAFFSGMPTDGNMGMAFILVQHMAPDHKSMLSTLVKRYTRMQVFDVEDGMPVQPDCVYIIPPNWDLALLSGALQLHEPSAARGHRLPIDFFFRSLAQDQHERAICVVLSGTGSDGTLGAREVKGAGGMVMAQSPDTTEFSGMPQSAIVAGLVDLVLPPQDMAHHLTTYALHAFKHRTPISTAAAARPADGLNKIFFHLRSQTGHDFSHYKHNTILRRIERRMAVKQVEEIDAYVRMLQQTPAEVQALFFDLLIGVTHFFRDADAFEALQKSVVAEFFTRKPSGEAIRVWVPGCSTGEEAYSIAILLREQIESLRQDYRVQIFATDIDRRSIDIARAGLYPASVAADISAERLARFFVSEQGGSHYRIHKLIRDMVVFSEQDVARDPPFSRLDLVSCRNLLIYMGPELQQKLLPVFHYALNSGGVLFLGNSESLGNFADSFDTLDRKWKIYRKKTVGALEKRLAVAMPSVPFGRTPEAVPLQRKSRDDSKQAVRDLVERTLLDMETPAAVLVNERGDILYLHGRTGRLLEPTPGEPVMNILKMAREGLRRELTTALHRAVSLKETVYQPGLRIKGDGDLVTVDLSVRPLQLCGDDAPVANCLLVVMDEVPGRDVAAHSEGMALSAGNAEVSARIAALEQELRAKEEYLQTTLEEMETSGEELKSSNEELQSTNEELQSTNEELETSKEEMQSLNEELATVNAELQIKLTDLTRANNDMNNLLAGTGIGTIFVDHQLLIQRFTPSITQVINLIEADVGRPVGHIVSNLEDYNRLVEDLKEVLDSLVPKEIPVKTRDGDWYLLRIRPYRTIENVIEGAVITFTDITELRLARERLEESEASRQLAAVLLDAHDAIIVSDLEGHITAWNPGAVRAYGWTEEESLGLNISALVPEALQADCRAQLWSLANSATLQPLQTQRITKDGHSLTVWVTATVLLDDTAKPYAVMTTERILLPPTELGSN